MWFCKKFELNIGNKGVDQETRLKINNNNKNN